MEFPPRPSLVRMQLCAYRGLRTRAWRPLCLPPATFPAPLRGAKADGPGGAFRYVVRPAVRGRPKPRPMGVID